MIIFQILSVFIEKIQQYFYLTTLLSHNQTTQSACDEGYINRTTYEVLLLQLCAEMWLAVKILRYE